MLVKNLPLSQSFFETRASNLRNRSSRAEIFFVASDTQIEIGVMGYVADDQRVSLVTSSPKLPTDLRVEIPADCG